MIYAPNPKNYTNYIMQKKKYIYIGKFLETNQLLKILNYKYLMTKNINHNFFLNQINFAKNQKKRYVAYLCVIPPSCFFPLFQKDLK
jgi:hypothetical protein